MANLRSLVWRVQFEGAKVIREEERCYGVKIEVIWSAVRICQVMGWTNSEVIGWTKGWKFWKYGKLWSIEQ